MLLPLTLLLLQAIAAVSASLSAHLCLRLPTSPHHHHAILTTQITDELHRIYTTMDAAAVHSLLHDNLPDREYVELMAHLFAGRPEAELARFLADKMEVLYEYKMSMRVQVDRLFGGVEVVDGGVLERVQLEAEMMERRLLADLMNQADYIPRLHQIYQTLSTAFPTTPQLQQARRPHRPSPPPATIPLFLLLAISLIAVILWRCSAKRQSKRTIVQESLQVGHRHSQSLQEQIQKPVQGYNPYRVEVVSVCEPPPAYTPR